MLAFFTIITELAMTLTQHIAEDMKAAMKAGDKTTLETLRSLRAAILDIEKQKVGTTLSNEDDLNVLNTAAKKRREAIDQYRQAGREDLAAQEERELQVIQRYLPPQLTEAELLACIDEAIAAAAATSMKDFGKVMGPLMKEVKGRADGAAVQALLKTRLGAGNA
jgi:uncharacterized protein YqeY